MNRKKRHLKKTSVTKPKHPGSAKHPSYEEEVATISLVTLQDRIGNQAMQRLLAQHGGKLDEKTLTRLTGENGSATHNLAKTDTVQREDEEADKPQTQPSNGEVTFDEVEYDYYDVSGGTLAEVAEQLDPEEWGRCTYHFDYSYETTNGRTTKVDITLKLTIRLPRWQGQGWDKASPAAKNEWRRMLKALEKHEEDHADIARNWAPRFKARLLNQRSNSVERRYNQTLEKVDKETKQFDQKTKHGQTQGVNLDINIK